MFNNLNLNFILTLLRFIFTQNVVELYFQSITIILAFFHSIKFAQNL